jgi:hypothetical protein
MTTRNKDEIRAANTELMGVPLGEIYSELWQEVARLFTKWQEYVELFGTKESRIHLMNEAASDFFGKLQDSGFRQVLLDIACVTDAAKIGKKENLSVRALPDLIADQELKKRVSTLVNEALEKAQFARDWRNRHLAHRDLELALGKAEAKPLEEASREKTWTALRALGAVLDEVSQHYEQSPTAWEIDAGIYAGALSLLHVVDDGVRVERERRKRLETGEILQSDFNRDV